MFGPRPTTYNFRYCVSASPLGYHDVCQGRSKTYLAPKKEPADTKTFAETPSSQPERLQLSPGRGGTPSARSCGPPLSEGVSRVYGGTEAALSGAQVGVQPAPQRASLRPCRILVLLAVCQLSRPLCS